MTHIFWKRRNMKKPPCLWILVLWSRHVMHFLFFGHTWWKIHRLSTAFFPIESSIWKWFLSHFDDQSLQGMWMDRDPCFSIFQIFWVGFTTQPKEKHSYFRFIFGKSSPNDLKDTKSIQKILKV
jgi:hypothetical protein